MDSGQSSCPWLERVLLKGFDGNLYILPMAKSEQLRYNTVWKFFDGKAGEDNGRSP